MKALSVKQPWAWAIMRAGKTIENRPRRTHLRETIAIHASLRPALGWEEWYPRGRARFRCMDPTTTSGSMCATSRRA